MKLYRLLKKLELKIVKKIFANSGYQFETSDYLKRLENDYKLLELMCK